MHCAALLQAGDFLVKCDDDVLFIAGLPVLLREAQWDAGAHLMYYPSVVNNDVSASFQAADGLLTDPEFVAKCQYFSKAKAVVFMQTVPQTHDHQAAVAKAAL